MLDAIGKLDAIKARMGDCRDESEARKFLAELTRAEEAVTIKRIREPRLLADLTALRTTAEDAFYTAFGSREAPGPNTAASRAELPGPAERRPDRQGMH